MYSEKEKNLVMVLGDLLEDPLSQAEKEEMILALDKAGDSWCDIPSGLPPSLREHVDKLRRQSLKFSLEMEKLSQRGVKILLPEKEASRHLSKILGYKPKFLFSLGDASLLDCPETSFHTSLASLKESHGKGILVSDRAFDELMRDEAVIRAVANSDALLVADAFRSASHLGDDFLRQKNESEEGSSSSADQRSVFVSGSRSQAVIPKVVQDSLEAIMSNGFDILIGDSDKGVDKEIIDFLRVPLYENVVLYSVSRSPRVPPEDAWRVETVQADEGLGGRERQMVKDRAMAARADWGLALFNPIEKNRYGALQVSAGTLRNAIQMLLQRKKVKFVYCYEGDALSRTLRSLDDLESVIESYRDETLTGAEAKSIKSAKGVSPKDDAAAVKAEKIMRQYRKLLRTELQEASASSTEGKLGLDALGSSEHGVVQEALPMF